MISHMMLKGEIRRRTIGQISKGWMPATKSPDDWAIPSVYVGYIVCESTADEIVSWLVLVDSVDMNEIEGIIFIAYF